jgi:hypothetical protein
VSVETFEEWRTRILDEGATRSEHAVEDDGIGVLAELRLSARIVYWTLLHAVRRSTPTVERKKVRLDALHACRLSSVAAREAAAEGGDPAGPGEDRVAPCQEMAALTSSLLQQRSPRKPTPRAALRARWQPHGNRRRVT